MRYINSHFVYLYLLTYLRTQRRCCRQLF